MLPTEDLQATKMLVIVLLCATDGSVAKLPSRAGPVTRLVRLMLRIKKTSYIEKKLMKKVHTLIELLKKGLHWIPKITYWCNANRNLVTILLHPCRTSMLLPMQLCLSHRSHHRSQASWNRDMAKLVRNNRNRSSIKSGHKTLKQILQLDHYTRAHWPHLTLSVVARRVSLGFHPHSGSGLRRL